MTSRPKLATGVNYLNGAAAVLLFAVMASVFVTAGFEPPITFGEGSIVASIGYAMFDMLGQIPSGHGETEGFLVAFILIAIVLDAALDGTVMLARREEDGSVVTALTDGGRRIVGDADDETTEAGNAETADGGDD